MAEKGLPPLGPTRVSYSLPTSVCILLFLFSSPAFDLGSTPSLSWCPSPSSEDVDTTIEDVTAEAAAEAEKIAAEEVARGATEDAAKGATEGPDKGHAEEPGKGPAKETGKGTAEEAAVDDQPSSSAASGSGKYLKVGEDLFVHLPGASSSRAPIEGEMLDDEVLAAAGLEVVDEPIVGGDGSQEERLLHAMGASFRKLQALHRARLDKAKSRTAVVEKAEADLQKRVAEAQNWFREAHKELKAAQGEQAKCDVELTMKLADIEKAEEAVKNLAEAAEAARTQHEAALNSQEEDLAAREEKLAAMLRGKDAEVEKLVLQRTSELEQRHKEALNAQAQVHAGKVKELEAEWDELKEQALKLSQEKDTLNGALTEAQGAAVSRAGELSEANNSIKDLKLKLEGLEKMLSEAKTREGTLAKSWRPRSSCGRSRASTSRITWRARTVGSIASPPSPTRPPRSWPSWGCRT